MNIKEKNMSAQKNKQMDMLNGPLLKKILIFALPLAASSILQQLFNSADVAVVGRFAGSKSLAAVGGNTPVISLLINLFVGLSVGANVVIGNYIGQGKKEKVKEAVHTVMAMAVICGVFLLIIGTVLARPILMAINTPDEVLPLAMLYLRIYFVGMPFVMVYNFGAAVLRSIGDTKRPLYALIVSGIINICLNLVLVIVFKLDVAGVAIATVIADCVSASLVTYFLMTGDEMVRFNPKKMSLKKEQVIKIIKIGAPAGLQGVVFSVSNVCIQSAINGFGTKAIAGSSAALNYEYFTYFLVNAFAQATVTFTSQNYGAGDYGRCKKIFHISMVFSLVSCGLLSMVFVLGRGMFLRFYTTDPAVLEYAMTRILIATTLELLTSVYEISAGAMRGFGHSLTPAVITFLGSCVLRLIWVSTVCRAVHEFWVLVIIYPISWVVTGIVMTSAYYIVRKRAFAQNVQKAA